MAGASRSLVNAMTHGGGKDSPGFPHDDDEPVIDLEDYVREWALDCYKDQKIKGDPHAADLEFRVDWRRVHFDYEDPFYEESDNFKINLSRNIHSQVLLRTSYVNDTDKTQEYTFKAERTMKSTAAVSVEKGFRTGADMRLVLRAPEEIVEVGGGISREIELRDVAENTVEEELLFAIDSRVVTPPRTESIVKLVMNEAVASSPFKLRVHYKGRVLVKLYHSKTKGGAYYSTIQGELFDVIEWAAKHRGLKGFNMQDESKGAFTQVSGKCNFKFGVEQKAHVTQVPISVPSFIGPDLRTLAIQASNLAEKRQQQRDRDSRGAD